MRLLLGVPLCVVLLVLSPIARAQEPPDFELPDVVSPGRRPQGAGTTPAYVTALSGDELRRLGFLTLGDALAFFAESYVRAAGVGPGSSQQASIRGSTPQQVQVLVDGVPLNATAQFGVNLNTITLAEVERVEVLRGPYSALHGNFAVVNVVTRRAPGTRAAGSYGTQGTALASLRTGFGSGGSGGTLAGDYLTTGGYRPNADAARWTWNVRFTLDRVAGGSLSFGALRTTGEGGLPGPTSFASLTDRLGDGRTLLSAEWSRTTPGGGRTLLRAWTADEALRFVSPAFGFFENSAASASGVEWQRVARVRGAVLTAGADWQRSAYGSQSTFSAFDSSASSLAAYLQLDLPIGARSLAGAGLRYETHSVYGDRLEPRIGFVHFLSPAVRLRGGWGRTSRAPTLGELFFPFCSNPALRPERASVMDLGVEVAARPGLVLRANAFRTDASDLIVGGCAPQNIGSARVAGASLEAVGRLSAAWSLMGNLTWTDGVDQATGLRLLRVPAAQANLMVRYASGGTALTLLVAAVGERDDLDFSAFPAARVTLPAYATVGVRVERAVGVFIVRAGVDNLFDVPYETLRGYPAPGRTFFVHVGGTR